MRGLLSLVIFYHAETDAVCFVDNSDCTKLHHVFQLEFWQIVWELTEPPPHAFPSPLNFGFSLGSSFFNIRALCAFGLGSIFGAFRAFCAIGLGFALTYSRPGQSQRHIMCSPSPFVPSAKRWGAGPLLAIYKIRTELT